MFLLILSILWCVTIAVMLIRAVRQYGYYQVIGPDDRVPSDAPSIAVIVPARNESGNIRGCLEGLLAQRYPRERLSIIVVDDNSTDDTAEVVRHFARDLQAVDPPSPSPGTPPEYRERESSRGARVQLIQAGPLPAGWLGKPHACAAGAWAAGEVDFLCFCDADTVAQPLLLNTAIKAAQGRDAALLSLEPFQKLILPCERLVVPCGFFLLAFTQDVRRASDPANAQAHANGQFMLIRRSAYEAVGTFAAVRDQIAEDSAMARLMKRAGKKIAVLGTKNLIAARMYRTIGAMCQGLSRQAGQLLGSPSKTLVFAMFALACAVLTPLLPALSAIVVRENVSSGSRAIAIASLLFACAGSLSLLGTHIGVARYFKIPWYCGILFPIGYTIGAGILFHSALARWRGRVPWKGREYPWA
jgi:chlorobactene glucosyltransferase